MEEVAHIKDRLALHQKVWKKLGGKITFNLKAELCTIRLSILCSKTNQKISALNIKFRDMAQQANSYEHKTSPKILKQAWEFNFEPRSQPVSLHQSDLQEYKPQESPCVNNELFGTPAN